VSPLSNADWRRLLEDLSEARLAASDFERLFLDAHRAAVAAGESVPYAVDLMFYEVDAYSPDPSLRAPDDNDDEMLRAHAQRLLGRFDEAWPKLPGSPSDAQVLENLRRAAARLNGKRT
jgi:hypothetical protein